MVARRKEVALKIAEWKLEDMKAHAAIESFLKYLDIAYDLGSDDSIDNESGLITRVTTTPVDVAGHVVREDNSVACEYIEGEYHE